MGLFLKVVTAVLGLSLFIAVFGIVTDDDVYYGMRAHNANVVSVAKLGQLYPVHDGELIRDPVCSLDQTSLGLVVKPTQKYVVATNVIGSVVAYSRDFILSIASVSDDAAANEEVGIQAANAAGAGAVHQAIAVSAVKEVNDLFTKKFRLDEFYVGAVRSPVFSDCIEKVVEEISTNNVCPISKIYRFHRNSGTGGVVFAIEFSEICLCQDGEERDCRADGIVKYDQIAEVPMTVKLRSFLNFTSVSNRDIHF